ncbi:M56 family metallopeptidase [Yaniella halotolerans]|uniref:M56 family metallopeptidase n=1 Tax=Yaniella halotolerans TaxID=225453 RepID=UPI0003B4F4B1|nr:M56 family metallopeptidase [Yaniella halotolerans]
MLTPYLLACLAILLAWPVPLWLQKAKWPSRAPGAALILWQAIGLSGGLALVTAPLTWGLQPFGNGILSASTELWHVLQSGGIEAVFADDRWEPFGFAAITLGCILFGHLTLVLLHTTYTTFSQRKKHREFVEVLSASLGNHDHELDNARRPTTSTRVLPVEHPLAYCLPAINQPITVVSRGLLDELSPRQLAAVLAHESAHLTQRHDLLRLAFQAWHKAVPWFPATRAAVNEVTQLTEIMADDAALSQHERNDLKTALARTLADTAATTQQPLPGTETQHTAAASRRFRRLITPDTPLDSCRVSLVIISAALLITVPAAVSLL